MWRIEIKAKNISKSKLRQNNNTNQIYFYALPPTQSSSAQISGSTPIVN
jgi:hypothetical protein